MYSLGFGFITATGVIVGVLTFCIRLLHCNVIYLVTNMAVSVWYLHKHILLSFPLPQLKVVVTRSEEGRSDEEAEIELLFCTDRHSSQCLKTSQSMGWFAPKLLHPGNGEFWLETRYKGAITDIVDYGCDRPKDTARKRVRFQTDPIYHEIPGIQV